MRESCADPPYCPLRESFRWEGGTILLRLWCTSGGSIRAAAEASWCLREWKRWCVGLIVFTVWQLHRSFTHQIKEKLASAPLHDNSNVVTGSFFEKRKYHSYTWRSVCHPACHPVCQILFITFPPEKLCLFPATDFNSQTRLQWTFPQKTESLPMSERVKQHPLY